jgi:hypothetical protein
MKKAKRVIVRTYSAGVHYGTLVSRKGRVVVLSNAKRIWYWRGANTLHEISLRGVGSGSKISERVDSITLTEAIEVIICTAAAAKNLDSATWQ